MITQTKYNVKIFKSKKDRIPYLKFNPQFLVNLNYLFDKYSSIAAAAFLPAPIASITVAAPVTASPPA